MEKDIIKVSADIGEKMIENGAEISRAEDTVRRILEASGISRENCAVEKSTTTKAMNTGRQAPVC